MLKTVRDVCQYVGSVIQWAPECIETGCTYTCAPGDEVHTTTNNIVEFVCKERQGRLISIDIDHDHLQFARGLLSKLGIPQGFVWWLEGDSVERLSRLNTLWPVDLLCLDSKEFDEDHMVNEYRAIEASLRPDKHFVFVDDIHNANSVKYKKMVPLLKSLGYEYIEVPTPTGLFVAAKGYGLPE